MSQDAPSQVPDVKAEGDKGENNTTINVKVRVSLHQMGGMG